MITIERRQLTEAEKAQVVGRYGVKCFIDGHPIDSQDDLEFDHVKPVAAGGLTTVENSAPVCRKHNREKRTMSLSEYRDLLTLRAFFANNPHRYLDDVIRAKGGQPGQKLRFESDLEEETVTLYFEGGAKTVSMYTDPVTGWRYFYALIPIRYLKNDKDLQPRALRQDSMWGLYRHFQLNTQLAPSICRLDAHGQLLLFDGQHKAASQIWAGRTAVECKVYIEPVAKRLKETNLEAHDSYRQMSFYSHELMRKYADIFGEDWEAYAALGGAKSEKGFVDFLIETKKMSRAKANGEIARAIRWRILNDPENRLRPFISDKSRALAEPLTFNRVEKTIFKDLLSPIPSEVEFQSDGDYRDAEERNLVRLMSIIADEGPEGRWSPERNDATHKRMERIFSAGAVRAWVAILRDVLNAHLRLYMVGPKEAERVLHRQLTEDDFDWIRRFVRVIFEHPVWDAPDTPDGAISKRLTKDDDTTAASLLKEYGLETRSVMEGAGATAH